MLNLLRAKEFIDDMLGIVRLLNGDDRSIYALRGLSMTLRKFFLQEQLIHHIAAPRVGKVFFPTVIAGGPEDLKYTKYEFCLFGTFDGASKNPAFIKPVNLPPGRGFQQEDIRYDLRPMQKFLKGPRLHIHESTYSNGEVIRFAANLFGGAHSSNPRNDREKAAILDARKLHVIARPNGQIAIGGVAPGSGDLLSETEIINGTNIFSVSCLAVARDLFDSPQLMQLCAVINKELKEAGMTSDFLAGGH